MSELFLGMISGTSIDGVDAVLAEIGEPDFRILSAATTPFPASLHARLQTLVVTPQTSLRDFGALDVAVGRFFAECALRLLAATGRKPEDVAAIGSHGQTVYHEPNGAEPFTLQIGDPNVIAAANRHHDRRRFPADRHRARRPRRAARAGVPLVALPRSPRGARRRQHRRHREHHGARTATRDDRLRHGPGQHVARSLDSPLSQRTIRSRRPLGVKRQSQRAAARMLARGTVLRAPATEVDRTRAVSSRVARTPARKRGATRGCRRAGDTRRAHGGDHRGCDPHRASANVAK